MADIALRLVTVAELLLTSKLLVPGYQRRYSWKEKQREVLIHDLYQHLVSMERFIDRYFCGSVIVERTEAGRFGIADGQQRVTTILLIFKGLLTFQEVSKSDVASEILSIVQRAQGGLLVFEDNKQDREFMYCIQRSDCADCRSTFDVAYKQVINILAGLSPEKLHEFADHLLHHTTFALTVAPNNSGLMLFERANNRGLPLSLSDKCKSIVLNSAQDVRTVSRRWEQFLTYCQTTDRSSDDHILNYLWVNNPSGNRVVAGAALDFFQQLVTEKSSDIIVRDMESYGEYTSSLYLCTVDNLQVTCRNFKHLNCLKKQYQIRAVMVAVRHYSQNDQRKLLWEFEKTAMVIALTSPLPGTVTNMLGEVVIQLQTSIEVSSIANYLGQYRTTCAYDMDDSIRHKMFVGSMNNIRAFLYYMEAFIQETSGGLKLSADVMGGSIEHIYPQSKRISEPSVDLIGNLTLLDQPINSKIGNASFAEKISAYEYQRFLLTQTLVRDFQVEARNEILRPLLYKAAKSWSRQDILKRGKMLSKLASIVFDYDYVEAAERVEVNVGNIEIPQANNLKSVYYTLLAVDAGNDTTSDIFEFHRTVLERNITVRETRYTVQALEMLELVFKNDGIDESAKKDQYLLTATGQQAAQLDYQDFVQEHVATNPLLISLSRMTRKECMKYIEENTRLTGDTVIRRYSCLKRWFEECGLVTSNLALL